MTDLVNQSLKALLSQPAAVEHHEDYSVENYNPVARNSHTSQPSLARNLVVRKLII